MDKKKLIKSMGIGDNELKNKVRELVIQGYGSVVIGRELGIDPKKALMIIRKLKEEDETLPNSKFDPTKNDSSPQKKAWETRKKQKQLAEEYNKEKPAAQTITNSDIKDKIQEIKLLKDEGLTNKQIAEQLSLTEGSVVYWSSKLSSNRTKINRIDEIRSKLDEGEYETYDLAMRYGRSPFSIKSMVKRAENKLPAQEWVKRAASRGVKLSYLNRELGIKTLERAKQVLEENFPGCFVFTTEINEDYILTPLYSSKDEVEWMGPLNRDFDYNMVPEGNYMTVKFKDHINHDQIVIWALSDLHKGSKYCRNDLIKQVVEIIKNNENHYAILLGDLTETVTKISVADSEEQYLTNSQQTIEIVKDLLPIANKLIAYRSGNHCEGRLMKAGQFNQAEVIASMLKVPYFNTRGIVDIEYSGIRKIMSLEHKYGSAFKTSQIIDSVDRIQAYNTYFTNIFWTGHTHSAISIPKESLELIPGKGFISKRWWIANTGSTMQRTGSYAEKSNYGPTPQDFVRYIFDSEGNDNVELVRVDCI